MNLESKILHFQIQDKLGEGGMGEVYAAEDLKLGRRVAIKILPWQIRKDEKARQRLFQEARSASLLNHPNIVTIHSIEETEDLDVLVMEYIEGQTLSALIQQEGELDLPAISNLGEQIAEALFAAHAVGIIHRDIKTSNILVTPRGRVKVLDFGLAKMTTATEGRSEEITEPGSVIGTPSYMSPEQVKGELLDSRSDLFSFGCVLYQMATGRLPFNGSNPAAILYQIAMIDPVLPSILKSDLPREFDSIIVRALAKNKERRYSSAIEMANDLQKLGLIPTQRLRPLDVTAQIIDSSLLPESSLLVGREAELTRLGQALELSRNGNGKILFISGEAGIGKTSLINTFLEILRVGHPEMIIARGQCVEQYGTGEAYLPFMDAIGSLLSSNLKDHLISVLRDKAPTWYLQFPAAFASDAALKKSKMESIGAGKERMLREISDGLIALSGYAPIVLALEDLHWADPSTVDLLRYLSHRLPSLRILILGTFRDVEMELQNPALKACRLELQSHSLSQEIALKTLQPQDIRTYIDRFFAGNDFTQKISPLIYKKTEGLPLFVTNLLQFLVDREILKKEGKKWTLERELDETDLQVPETVSSMIRKKIESLTEEERRILQYASVEGVEVLSSVLAALLEKEEVLVDEELIRISKSHGIIHPVGEEELPDGTLVTRYRFAHALFQNVLEESLVSKRRVLLNRRTAEELIRYYGAQSAQIANKLAVHFKAGRENEKAFEYFLIAGDHAKKLFANVEAASLYRDALDQLRELSTKQPNRIAEWDQFAANVHEKLADVLAIQGNQKEARSEYENSAKKVSDNNRLAQGRLHRKIAKAWETERGMERALKEYEISESLLQENPDDAAETHEWIQLQLDRSWLHYTRNELESLDRIAKGVEAAVQMHGTGAQKARFFQTLLNARHRRFRYVMNDASMEYSKQAVRAAIESGDPGQIGSTIFGAGFSHLWYGDLDLAREKLLEGLATAEKIGDAVLKSRCLTYLTIAYRKLRDVEEVRERLSQCFDLCVSIRMDEYVAAAHANRAWLSLQLEDPDETVRNGEIALRIWASLPLVYPFQGLALWPLTSVAHSRNETTSAIGHLQALLHTDQQRLSDNLTASIQTTIQLAHENRFEDCRASLTQTLNQARLEKHL